VIAITTTWIKPIHKAKGKSVAATLSDHIGYADNPDKTDGFEYVKSYGCDYYTAANEFALSKQLYENKTGRAGRNGDIIAYHLRQSFKPGEINPTEALEVGYALADKFTHGKHQFVAAVHTDKQHIHCHIIFNAVNSDCDRKFRNPIGSMRIVRQISDYLCAGRGLSIVENPKKSRGSYQDWQDKNEPQSNRDKLMELIDNNIRAGMMFEEFLAAMSAAGCEVKRSKNKDYLSFKIPGAQRFIRVKSLDDDYREQALRDRCTGRRSVVPKQFEPFAITKETKFSLLIDIQKKIQEGKGEAYENWAVIYNLQQAARTLIFLKENGIDSYDDLVKKSSAASSEFNRRLKRIKEVEDRLGEISELQKQIGTYGKTKQNYAIYRDLKNSKQPLLSKLMNNVHPAEKFYEENRVDIVLHETAKKYFDLLGMKKLPPINTLKQEWAELNAEKNKLYNGYQKLKAQRMELIKAKDNVERLLGVNRNAPEQQRERKQISHER
jgi:hypothetical protein